MESLKGSPFEKVYSVLYSKHVAMIKSNKSIERLVFQTYDDVVMRQRDQFTELFKSTLHATFANPWVFLKKTSASLDDDEEEIMLPSLPDTKDRIAKEMPRRSGNERMINKWIYSIPEDPSRITDAADMVQLLVVKVYSHIRSQVCNQVELFADSFFKLPLM